jgi:hypothetical protein
MANRERDLYPVVLNWLDNRLRCLYPGWSVEVFDTSRSKLSAFLDRLGVRSFPASDAFEIEVDLTAIVRRRDKAQLVFIECKSTPITLKDLGQILGYSRVASPVLSAIVSPEGISRSLDILLNTYNRVDILEYGPGRRIRIATWDPVRQRVDPASVFPAGGLG